MSGSSTIESSLDMPAVEEPMQCELVAIADLASNARGPSLVRSAFAFAASRHFGQRRDSDGAAFIDHPIEVARLLHDAGCSQAVIAAGLLHDVVEKTDASVAELEVHFGHEVAALVEAVSEDAAIQTYPERKHQLREQVRNAGHDAALVFAADKVSKVRELSNRPNRHDAPPAESAHRQHTSTRLARLEHYHECLRVLQDVEPHHPLVRRLANELTDT